MTTELSAAPLDGEQLLTRTVTMPEYCGEYEVHPIASLFPMMPDDELDALAEDIKQHGQRESIVLARDSADIFHLVVIDGRNRYEACRRAGVEPDFGKFYGIEPKDIGAWIVSQNIRRRHLTTSQRAALAVEFEKLEAVAAKERERERKSTPKANESTGANLPHSSDRAPQARDKAAELFNVSGRSVSDAKLVEQQDPGAFNKIRDGKGSVSGEAKPDTQAAQAHLQGGITA